MPEVEPPSRRGAESILHPHSLQSVVSQRLECHVPSRPSMRNVRLDQIRDEALRAQTIVGAAHPGPKGRAAHWVKSKIRRALYWYVEPAVDRLRATNLALIDVAGELAREMRRLEHEVESLRRDLDRDSEMQRQILGHRQSQSA